MYVNLIYFNNVLYFQYTYKRFRIAVREANRITKRSSAEVHVISKYDGTFLVSKFGRIMFNLKF